MLEKLECVLVFGVVCWKVFLLDKEMLLFLIMSMLVLGVVIVGGVWIVYMILEL